MAQITTYKRPVPQRYLTNQKSLSLGKKPNLQDTSGSEKIEIDYFRFYESLYRKEIYDWQQARIARRDPFNASTYLLQQLYKDAMLDNHLCGAIENRILRVLNKEFVLKNADGDIDRKLSSQIQTRWFRHIVRKALESKFYGYSLIFIENLNKPERTVLDLPRENVLPEKDKLLKNALDPSSQSINFRDFKNYFIYVQLNSDAIGILERIAPLTIYKRHSWANWG